MNKKESSLSFIHLLPLFIIYLVWGSTYLAIRFTVREGSGFPPFTAGFLRFFAGGGLLLLFSALRKKRIKPTRSEWATLIISGMLLLTGGNGMVLWAEQKADSGLAALLVAAVPLWTILIEAVLNRKKPSAALVAVVLVGFGGIALLTAPEMLGKQVGEVLPIAALLLAGFSWALGTIRQTRRPVQLDPLVSSAYQMLSGGTGLLLLSFLNKEPLPHPTTDAWLALVYLILFGSVLGYTAYVIALKNLPIHIVVTYTYVNPIIAIFLGWLILDERISIWMVGGTLLVLLAVAGVFRLRYQNDEPDEA